MSGINVSGRNRATSKAASALASFLFEQEFGELKNFTSAEKVVLKNASSILIKHC